jgi:hypothetical protein
MFDYSGQHDPFSDNWINTLLQAVPKTILVRQSFCFYLYNELLQVLKKFGNWLYRILLPNEEGLGVF